MRVIVIKRPISKHRISILQNGDILEFVIGSLRDAMFSICRPVSARQGHLAYDFNTSYRTISLRGQLVFRHLLIASYDVLNNYSCEFKTGSTSERSEISVSLLQNSDILQFVSWSARFDVFNMSACECETWCHLASDFKTSYLILQNGDILEFVTCS